MYLYAYAYFFYLISFIPLSVSIKTDKIITDTSSGIFVITH